jgi:hypothetical protein
MLEMITKIPISTQTNRDELVDLIAGQRLPPGPVLALSTLPTGDRLAAALSARLHRPVAEIDYPEIADCDFYERPVRHETP